eukprot:4776525-Prymnesium_polylepis.1
MVMNQGLVSCDPPVRRVRSVRMHVTRIWYVRVARHQCADWFPRPNADGPRPPREHTAISVARVLTIPPHAPSSNVQ